MAKQANKKSVLVIFSQKLPKKKGKWWKQFSQVIAPLILKEEIEKRGVLFMDIGDLADHGSVQEAFKILGDLSRLTLPDGSRLSKLVKYQGYEVWWMNYGYMYYKFCMPYTQYRRLLDYLKDFDKTYLYRSSHPELFAYFLTAYNRQCVEIRNIREKMRHWFLPGGVILQLILSALFLPILIIKRPKVMYRIGDMIDPPLTCDFRHKLLYQELFERKINFVEFVRSLQPWHMVLRNAWRRKRPVIYCSAIIYFIVEKLRIFEKRKDKKLINSIRTSAANPEERFWLLVATHYLKDGIRVTQWAIRAMQWILQLIGVKSAIIISASSRALREVLGCKLAGIKTVGIQHGLAFRWYLPHDFLPGYDGEKSLSIDRYGLWSEWWKEYYKIHSDAYKQEQLYVSGHMRPLEDERVCLENSPSGEKLRVLLISEQLADPKEVMPYLSALLSMEGIDLKLKCRPQLDGFEEWLEKNKPEIFKKINISKEDIHQAISKSDVVVGSHSTAVLESLCQLKPFIFFWTDKWGDYYEVKSFDSNNYFFARSPEELIEKIKKSAGISKEELKKLQERFFGDPRRNGAKWVVDQAEEFLLN